MGTALSGLAASDLRRKMKEIVGIIDQSITIGLEGTEYEEITGTFVFLILIPGYI